MTALASSPRSASRWLILALVLIVECMDLLDGTIVNVAAPSIRADLGSSLSALQWIAGGYALTLAVGLVTGGRLGDIHGHRRLFLAGVAGFALFSVLCGVAQSTGMLIACRLLQGLSGALMIPQGFGLVREAFGAEDVGKAFAFFGPVIGLSAVLGPVVGGLLTDGDLFGLGWRAIFLVNLPLAAVALIAGVRLLPETRAEHPPRLDLPGAALISVAVGLLVFPLIEGREKGWPAWTFASMAAALVVLSVFVAFERRRESPLVTMSLFGKRAFSAGLVCALVFFAGMIGLMLTFSLYLQIGLGFDALRAGLAFVPWSFGTAVGAGLGMGLLAPRIGRPTLHIGAGVMLAGVVAMIAVIGAAGPDLTVWRIAGPELLAGVGMGLLLSPLFDFVLAGVADDEVGSASGVLNAVQQLSGAIGIAALGTVFFSVLDAHGMEAALKTTLWIVAGLIAATAGLVFLLPRWAREAA